MYTRPLSIQILYVQQVFPYETPGYHTMYSEMTAESWKTGRRDTPIAK
jgi:hypothetical protein